MSAVLYSDGEEYAAARKKKKGGGTTTPASTYTCVQTCRVNGGPTSSASVSCTAGQNCCRGCNNGVAYAYCTTGACPDSGLDQDIPTTQTSSGGF